VEVVAVSNWFLYIGIFLCATGFGVVVGAIFMFYWGIMALKESEAGNSDTENNYTAVLEYKSDYNRTVPKEYISTETLEEGR
jgi:hypothetical protein